MHRSGIRVHVIIEWCANGDPLSTDCNRGTEVIEGIDDGGYDRVKKKPLGVSPLPYESQARVLSVYIRGRRTHNDQVTVDGDGRAKPIPPPDERRLKSIHFGFYRLSKGDR